MYSESDIRSLFEELERYEAEGKYRLADRVWKSLLKVAYKPQAKDLGAYGEAFSNAMNFDVFKKVVMNIPACQELFKIDKNGEAAIYADFKDQVGANMNTGLSLERAVEKVGLDSTADHPTWKLPEDESLNAMILECMKGLGKNAKSFGSGFEDVAAKADPRAPAPTQRSVPKIPAR